MQFRNHINIVSKLTVVLLLLFSVCSLTAIETRDGFLMEGDRTDYTPYEHDQYTPQIQRLRGTVVDNSKVFLFWNRIPYNGITYTIYRNTQPLDTYSAFQSAVVVAKIRDKNQLLDATIRSNGAYYYAVTTKADEKKEDLYLERNRAFLERPFVIRGINGRPAETDNHENRSFTADNLQLQESSSSIHLSWNVPENFSGRTHIFMSNSPITDQNSLRESRRIAIIGPETAYSVHPKPVNSSYFYILLEKNGTFDYTFRRPGNTVFYSYTSSENDSGRTAPENAVTPRENSDSGNYNNDIDEIVRNIYRTDNFDLIERQLTQIALAASSPEIKAKALFFIGRVRVEKGEYRKALRIFVRSDVQQYYKEDSQFWQDYCLSKLN